MQTMRLVDPRNGEDLSAKSISGKGPTSNYHTVFYLSVFSLELQPIHPAHTNSN